MPGLEFLSTPVSLKQKNRKKICVESVRFCPHCLHRSFLACHSKVSDLRWHSVIMVSVCHDRINSGEYKMQGYKEMYCYRCPADGIEHYIEFTWS